jgi:hypothetical protein
LFMRRSIGHSRSAAIASADSPMHHRLIQLKFPEFRDVNEEHYNLAEKEVGPMKLVLVAAFAAALAVLSAACATAAPGLVQTTVNLREGPGTSAVILAKIPGGSSVDVTTCTGEWCRVSFQGKSGYVIATSLSNGVGGNSPAGSPQGAPPPGYAGPPPAYPYPYPAYPYPG